MHRGHSLLLISKEGSLAGGAEGFYFRRTRFLSLMHLSISGTELRPISVHHIAANVMISYGVAALPIGDRVADSEIDSKALVLRSSISVDGGMHQDLQITNHAMSATRLVLVWDLAADYVDQDEVASGQRQLEAPVERSFSAEHQSCLLHFRYLQPGLDHATQVVLSGPGKFSCGTCGVNCELELKPAQSLIISIDIQPTFGGRIVSPAFRQSDGPAWRDQCSRLETSNSVIQAAWDRAAADLESLQLLEGEGEERLTPAAGVPKYLGLFGRDALVTALQASLLNAGMLRGTLRTLARWIARDYNDKYDAQPGKVLHQRQLGPLALLGRTPFLHYYGDHSAPALFLIGVAWDLAQTGDLAFFRSMRSTVLDVLAWMDRDGDLDGDGFYEYQTLAGPAGLKNQGWKNSQQAILQDDGSVAANPIATCEVQGLYYAAKQALALAFACDGDAATSSSLLAQAAALKERFNQRFWMPELNYFALALGPDKQQVRSIASNAGACLAYGIIDHDKAGPVIQRLLCADLFSGWGIRSLSSKHPAYNLFAYHLGSVWPSPTAIIARDMQRYGDVAAFHQVAGALFSATQLFTYNRLPEVFGGNTRDTEHPHPGLYPGGCAPQAWSAAAIIGLVGAMLGATPIAPQRLLMVDPNLPEWLSEVTLRQLRVGDATVTLRFYRDGAGHSHHEVVEQAGSLRVLRLPPAESSGSPGDRLALALRAVG